MQWAVFKRHPVRRGTSDGQVRAVFEWVRDPAYPATHPTAADARRALMESLMPELRGRDDGQIRQHYNPWQRNVGHHKVARVDATTEGRG